MLSLKNITLSIQNRPILSIDRLDISPNKNLLLLGASGSGKTTLLHIMAGLRRPDGGQILYEDMDLLSLSPKDLDDWRGKNCGFVFQNFHLLKHLTVAQNIALTHLAIHHPPAPSAITEILDQLGLAHKAHHKASTLSQGEAQRVAIARAVIHNPKIIFADEPTSALDDHNTHQIMDLLHQYATKNNATLIVATHDARIKDRFGAVLTL
jgi:putative ABC transport system ATP-binding protein